MFSNLKYCSLLKLFIFIFLIKNQSEASKTEEENVSQHEERLATGQSGSLAMGQPSREDVLCETMTIWRN